MHKNILVVDYEMSSFRIINGFFEDNTDYNVELIIDGKNLKNLCALYDPVLIFMNIEMPDINVMQMALKIKEDRPGQNVVLMSRNVGPLMDSTIISEIADSIIGIPLNFKKLARQLNRLLDIKSKRKKIGVFGI